MELEKVANKLMKVSEEGVSTISKLCREQVQLEQDIRELEGAIKVKRHGSRKYLRSYCLHQLMNTK